MHDQHFHIDPKSYLISMEKEIALITVTLVGFWDTQDVISFAQYQQTAVKSLGCPPGTHLVLADLSDFKLQSQEVVDACTTFINTAGMKAERLALVLGGGLAWMQAKRMVVRSKIAAFTDRSTARKWLLSGDVRLEEPIDGLLAKIAALKARQLTPPARDKDA